ADQQVLFDKMSVQMVELDKHIRDLKNTVLEKNIKISELEECVRNKDLEIEKCLERLNVCEKKLHKIGQTNQTVHMIMPSKDNLYNGRKGIGFENLSYFENAKDLRPTLYDEKCVSPVSMSKSSCDSNNIEIKLNRKRRKRKSSKQNVKQVDNDVSRANGDFVHFLDLDTFSSVRRPRHRDVTWKKKGSSNTSHLGETRRCSKHMTGNRALLTNFVEKFLGTVRFGNNNFVVIAGYGDVGIGSMTIKKVYYVEVLGHNLFSVGQFCDKGLEVAFRKST
nr:integrase, catalytic region, zinc finger, CCHC-type, peptidase aspartic, catalytic [Tanacetum cinerariifolium]